MLGAASLALLLYATVRGLLSGRKARNRLAVVLWAGYAGYLLTGLRSNQMWDRYIWTFLVLACAASVVARRAPEEPGDHIESTTRLEPSAARD